MDTGDKWLAIVLTVLVLGVVGAVTIGIATGEVNSRKRQAACTARGGSWTSSVNLPQGCYRVTVTFTPVDSVAAWR